MSSFYRVLCCAALLASASFGAIPSVSRSEDGAATTKTLVLIAGGAIAVESAEIKGSFVHFKLKDGRLQAYPIEDVDLELSGLLPSKEDMDDPSVPQQEGRPYSRSSLEDAMYREDTESVLTITDADVDHIEREEIQGGGEGGGASQVLLTALDIRKQVTGGIVVVTGVVKNETDTPVSSIVVLVTILDADGKSSGSGRVTIDRELKPNEQAEFSVRFPVLGPAIGIDVTPRGEAVVPTPPPGGPPPEGPGPQLEEPPSPEDRPPRREEGEGEGQGFPRGSAL